MPSDNDRKTQRQFYCQSTTTKSAKCCPEEEYHHYSPRRDWRRQVNFCVRCIWQKGYQNWSWCRSLYVVVVVLCVCSVKCQQLTLASATGTQDPQAVPFSLDGRAVTLIDTPGFDDDKRSDVQILEDIARWLARRAQKGKQLVDGIIFLHPITLNRVGGSERNRTRLLEKILGPNAFSRVFIATTMWDDLIEKGDDAAVPTEVRLQGRIAEGGVWHHLCSRGATILKHTNNRESAIKIIKKVIEAAEGAPTVEPLLQTELKGRNGRVIETAAGKELETQLMDDIKMLRVQLSEHERDRPPQSYKKHENKLLQKEWKDWYKNKDEMEDKLVTREQQLKKLGGLIVSTSRRILPHSICPCNVPS